MKPKGYYDLRDTTKRATQNRLKERAINAHNRLMKQVWGDDEIPSHHVVADAKIWVGRNVVLFDKKDKYITEYRWYPNTNRLRRNPES